MDSGVAASISLIAFWLSVGIAVWYYRHRRDKLARRKAEIERLMNEWIELERQRGTEPDVILDRAPFKRAEVEAMIEG